MGLEVSSCNAHVTRRLRAHAWDALAGAHVRSATAFAAIAALAIVTAIGPITESHAATSFERVPLSIDRSDLTQSDATWDQLQQLIRQSRRHSAASFSDTVDDVTLGHPSPAAGDDCGYSTASGDLNGDGRADLVMGCRLDDTGATDTGGAVVLVRNAANSGFETAVELANPTPALNDWCGWSVASGDINGDGRDDVVLGCPYVDAGGTDRGAAVVFTRNATNDGFDPGVELVHPGAVDYDRCSAVEVADVNGDGRKDVAIGCNGADAGAVDAGKVVVYVRNTANNGFDPGVSIADPTPTASNFCGFVLASGDFNADGRTDVAMGCSGDDTGAADAGNAVLFVRNAANTGFDTTELSNGSPAVSDGCYSVAAGDVNGDARDDLVLGCNGDNTGASDAGNLVVYTRNAANTGFNAGVELANPSPVAGDECGIFESVAVGDANGDGLDDIAMGCYHDDTGAGDAGNVVVFLRDASNVGFDTAAEQINPTPVASDQCGHSVSAADVDGDGREEFAMGCLDDDAFAANAGSVILVGPVAGTSRLSHPTPVASDQCATSTLVADVNGDGHGDVLMGCPLDDGGASNQGSVIVHVRNATNSGFLTPVVLSHPSPAANDECGGSLAAGDVNGDGRDDIVMGCWKDDAGAADSGSMVVFRRNAGNNGFDAGELVVDATIGANDRCGVSVSAGDVNGDGLADVAMGCYQDAGGGDRRGSAVVALSSGATIAAPSEWRHPTPVNVDWCGSAVALGDVNDDERADLAFGCFTDDTAGFTDIGTVVVRTRSTDNTTFDAGVVLYNSTTPAVTTYCTSQHVVGPSSAGGGLAIGDVNGDGLGDIAMGCERYNGSQGAVVSFVRTSDNTGFDAPTVHQISSTAPDANDYCGRSLALADVNGDGNDDIITGCVYTNRPGSDTGSAIVFTRNQANTAFDADRELVHPTPTASDECGESIAAGDIDADGRSDVVIGCWLDDTTAADTGSAIVMTSTSTGVAGSLGTVTTSEVAVDAAQQADDSCNAVEAADVNGDDRTDVVQGCWGYDDTAGDDNAGAMKVLTRNSANTGFDAADIIDSVTPTAGTECGREVGAGDVNGDGRDDIIMGCDLDATYGVNRGSAMVYTRNAANTGFDAGVRLGSASHYRCGMDVDAGDVNGDGREDVIVGCERDETGAATDAGTVLVFTRNATNNGFDAAVLLEHPSPDTDDRCGWRLDAGDINRDGRADIVTGCYRDDDGAATEAGSALVLLRNAANTGFDAGIVLKEAVPTAGDWCGHGMAVGDVDGDGYDDVLLGCRGDSTEATAAGDVHAFRWMPAGGTFAAGVRLPQPDPTNFDRCGYNVAAGDVNGDGREDSMAGCDNGPGGGAAEGGSTLIHAERSTSVQSRRLNRQAGTVSAVTVNLARIANGAAVPSIEVSANGGSTWESATLGASHAFGVTGGDLRVRARLPHAPTARMTQVLHDMTIDYTYTSNSAPNAPPLVTPAAAGSTSDTTPDLTATFSDPDGASNTGQLEFEVCTVAFTPAQTCVAAGGTLRASGSTAAGIAEGADGTWTVSPALVPQVVYWRARATDNGALTGPWSASRQLTIAETITIGVDSATAAIGSVVPGTDATATTVVTIGSNDPQGYTLSATDESDTWGADCACAAQVPDWTGTGATPTAWAALTSGYFGITVLDSTGVSTNRLAKWGAANPAGWPATDFTNNLYAGLDNGASSVLHDTAAATGPTDTISVAYRVNVGTSQQAGAYDATISYTATGKP